MYYKGTVTSVRQQMPSGGIDLAGRGAYDPWEALEVEWDVGGDAEGMDRVSPWEIEVSPFCMACCMLQTCASSVQPSLLTQSHAWSPTNFRIEARRVYQECIR